ncbi:MAG TPA: hypothetical protein QF753_18385 [Victivallales bacterium]|nr:hypothetical protein [Victivallales bacterium]
MKGLKLLLVIVTVLIIGISANAGTNKSVTKSQNSKLQSTCPVMGGKINKKQYIDVKDPKTGNTYRIYVCCKGCINAIKANPYKYIQKLKKKGVKLQKIDTKNSKNKKILVS